MSQDSTPTVPATQAFKTQLDCVQWLEIQGFKISKSTFSLHVKSGKVATNAAGLFEASALLGYAAVNLTPTVKIEDAKARETAIVKISVDSDLKAVRAERERLKLHREQGRLMPVIVHENELAARALFFKAEIEGFIHRKSSEIIALVDGKHDRKMELINWWNDTTADWMDAWSRERDFADSADEDEATTQTHSPHCSLSAGDKD